jgi:hypothetical protein
MRKLNNSQGRQSAGFLKLCAYILVALMLASWLIPLNTVPVQAAPFDIAPAVVNANLTECQPFSVNPPFSTTGGNCAPGPADFIFYWAAGIPAWVNIDMNTGELSGCPPAGANLLSPYVFQVGATELYMGPPACIFPIGFLSATTSTVTLTVAPQAPCVTDIAPTFYPVAWEMFPFSMTLTPIGGVGPLNWSATGLPVGLALDPALGIISGVPAPGTCGIYTVTATISDNGTCGACCPTISRPFILIVDCWSNYPSILYPITTCDFTVQIGPGLTQGQTRVLVDGSQETVLAGGGSETFTSIPCESHTVMVDQTVPGIDPQTRFSVIGSNIKTVSDIDNLAYFNYAQDVLIQTGSDPGGVAQPAGAGFYAIGANFISTAPSPVTPDNQNGVKYVFRSWRLPGGGTNPNRDLFFAVNTAGTATAVYDIYYLLSLKSAYPPVDENTWELKDSTATYNLALQPVPMTDFWGLIGGVIRPGTDKGSHLMTGPYTQTIEWYLDYTIPIIVISVIVLLIIGLVLLLTLRRKHGPSTSAMSTQAAQTATAPPVAAAEKTALPAAEPAEKLKFCPKCGTAAATGAIFCKNCGNKID